MHVTFTSKTHIDFSGNPPINMFLQIAKNKKLLPVTHVDFSGKPTKHGFANCQK